MRRVLSTPIFWILFVVLLVAAVLWWHHNRTPVFPTHRGSTDMAVEPRPTSYFEARPGPAAQPTEPEAAPSTEDAGEGVSSRSPFPRPPVATRPAQTPTSPLFYSPPLMLHESQPVRNVIQSDQWLPADWRIPCRTTNTIDTNNLDTPVIAQVTEDVYHHGVVVVPAGTQLVTRANNERTGSRLGTSTQWRMTLLDGRQMFFKALTLHRADNAGTAAIDMSAGLLGEVIERDPNSLWRVIGLSAAQGALDMAEDRAQTIFGESTSSTGRNTAIGGVSRPIDQLLREEISRTRQDPYFLRVQAGTPFYVWLLEPIDLSHAQTGAAYESTTTSRTSTLPAR